MKSDFTFTLPFTPLRPAALQGQGRRQDQLLHLLRGGRERPQALAAVQRPTAGTKSGGAPGWVGMYAPRTRSPGV